MSKPRGFSQISFCLADTDHWHEILAVAGKQNPPMSRSSFIRFVIDQALPKGRVEEAFAKLVQQAEEG